MSKLDESEESEDEEGSKEPSDRKFKPPMNVPQYYNEEGGKVEAEGEKRKKKALSRYFFSVSDFQRRSVGESRDICPPPQGYLGGRGKHRRRDPKR